MRASAISVQAGDEDPVGVLWVRGVRDEGHADGEAAFEAEDAAAASAMSETETGLAGEVNKIEADANQIDLWGFFAAVVKAIAAQMEEGTHEQSES